MQAITPSSVLFTDNKDVEYIEGTRDAKNKLNGPSHYKYHYSEHVLNKQLHSSFQVVMYNSYV